MQKQYDKGDISKLLDIMAALRDVETGCPWDLQQDFDTIAPHTIEEAYEVADVIERKAFDELPDELGDLLFQVVFQAKIAEERGLFAFGDVVDSISEKLLRRHPHVFGTETASSDAEVAANWDRIKRAEKPPGESVLAGVPIALPPLTRAFKLGRRAASVGFDWPSIEPVRAKIDEELAELDVAVAEAADSIEHELGDLLFAVVNYCRHLKVDPGRALRRSNDRFVSRFSHVASRVRAAGGDWGEFDVDALETFWESAKAAEKDVS